MSHHHHHDSSGNIKVAFFLNLGFTIVELIGGLMTNSVAILSDAIHDLGDSVSLGLSWYFEKKAQKQSDSNYSFGYQRYSLLGAFINGMILIIGSIFVLMETIPRLIHPEVTEPKGMIAISILGIFVNGAAVFKLKKGKTLNEKMLSWHLMEDLLGWIAVLIVSIILLFYPIHILDALLSLLIISYVLINVFKHLKETFKVFLQGVPSNVDLEQIKHSILSIENITSIHKLHVWSLDGSNHVFSIHIVLSNVDQLNEGLLIKKRVREILNNHGIKHATIELEEPS